MKHTHATWKWLVATSIALFIAAIVAVTHSETRVSITQVTVTGNDGKELGWAPIHRQDVEHPWIGAVIVAICATQVWIVFVLRKSGDDK
jgi:hypothetical protein